MKRKVKASFEELEKELSKVSSHQMFNTLGGSMDPLPNGYCHFNMVSAMIYGSNSSASSVRDEMYSMYGRDKFTDQTWTTNGVTQTGQSYNPDLLDSYMRNKGYESYNTENPSISQLQAGLDASGGKVGVSHDGHAWTIQEIKSNGDIVLKDTTNTSNPNKTVQASSISQAYFLSVPEGSTSHAGFIGPPEDITTPYDDITTPYDDITTPYATTAYTY